MQKIILITIENSGDHSKVHLMTNINLSIERPHRLYKLNHIKMRKIKDIILVIFPLHLQMLEFGPVQGAFQWKNRNLQNPVGKKNVNLHSKFLIFIFSCGKYQTILTP